MVRAIESIHHERHPGGAAFEKRDTQIGKLVEDTVGEHGRGLNHQTERMSQGVRRIVRREGIQTEVMKAADMNGESTTEFLCFFVNRPIDFCCPSGPESLRRSRATFRRACLAR